MGMSGATGMVKGLAVLAGALLLATPLVLAADGNPGVIADSTLADTTREQILLTIEETRQTDPELAGVMAEQLRELDSGNLQLRELVGSEREVAAGASPSSTEVPGGGSEYLPTEVRTQLEKLFQEKGTGDPSKDESVRQEAERILKEHGIDPREMGHGREWDQQGEGNWRDTNNDNLDDDSGSVLDGIGRGGYEGTGDRAMEQMSPEAREQMERFHEFEATSREYSHEAPEAGAREFETPTSERESETPAREYEAPSQESETPTRESEAPTHEFEGPMHEYEAPMGEYQAPQGSQP